MNKDKINKERKEKAKNIIFKILHGVSYALSTCFIATCIVACASSGAKNKSDNSPKSLIQYRIDGESESESVSYPIYNVNDYIELGGELLTYKYDNLLNVLSTSSNVYIDYNDFEYTYLENKSVNSYVLSDDDPQRIGLIKSYTSSGYTISFDNAYFKYCGDMGDWVASEGDSSEWSNIPSNRTLKITNLSSSNYESIKNAVELDIQANEEIESPTSDIFTAISDTITNFVIALNSGITAVVGLFWNSTSSALTPLGVLTTIVVGVALVYFVFRLIIGLIRLRG